MMNKLSAGYAKNENIVWFRSFRLNFEVTAVVTSQEFATEVESMMLDDFSASTRLTNYRLADLTFWQRLKARGSALLAPLL